MTTTARTKSSTLREIYFFGMFINLAACVVLSFIIVEPGEYYPGHPDFVPAKRYDTTTTGALAIAFALMWASVDEPPLRIKKAIKWKIKDGIREYKEWRGKC